MAVMPVLHWVKAPRFMVKLFMLTANIAWFVKVFEIPKYKKQMTNKKQIYDLSFDY